MKNEKNKAKQYTSPLIKKIIKSIPLKTRIFNTLKMEDYKNWDNGDYRGDIKKLIKSTSDILKEVFEWVDDGMPGKDDIDLSRYEK